MNTHPQLLGIGLDEATAIIVNKSQAKIVGKGKVHFYDRRKPVYPGKPDFIALSEGSVYDLKDRKIIVKSINDGQPPAGAGSNTEQASQK